MAPHGWSSSIWFVNDNMVTVNVKSFQLYPNSHVIVYFGIYSTYDSEPCLDWIQQTDFLILDKQTKIHFPVKVGVI